MGRKSSSKDTDDKDKIAANIAILKAKIKSGSVDEAEYLREYLHMFRAIKVMTRILEEKILDSGSSRDVYALNTLYSQQREVIADIRCVTDNTQLVEQLKADVVTPMAQQAVQVLTDVYYQMRKLVEETTSGSKQKFAQSKIDQLFKDAGVGISKAHDLAEQSVFNAVIGAEPEKPTRKKSRR